MKILKTTAAFIHLNDPNRRRTNLSCRHLQEGSLPHALSFNNVASLMSPIIQRRQRQSTFQLSAINNDNNDGEYDDGNDNSSDGIFLDETTYLQAEETLLRPDGSISGDPITTTISNQQNKEGMQNINDVYQSAATQGFFPPTYSYSNPDTKEEQDLSDEELLLQAVNDIQNDQALVTQQQKQIDAETLHQQVFAEEEVYLEQSDEFRKSLSNNNVNDTDYESPIAKGRREAIESYNQQILDDLMKELDEMEAIAVSRDEALSRAKMSGGDGGSLKNNSPLDLDEKEETSSSATATGRNNVVCSECGLKVTPDMIQRATYGPKRMLCQACYGVNFRIKNEAEVRLATGPSIWESTSSSSSKMFDRKNAKKRLDRSTMKRSNGIDTSSLFRIPDNRIPNEQNDDSLTPTSASEITKSSSPQNEPEQEEDKGKTTMRDVNAAKPSSPKSGSSGNSETLASNRSRKQGRRPTSPPLSGSRALERRKMQKQEPSTVDSNQPNALQQEANEGDTKEAKSDNWVKVEDSVSKRILYWNKETGEMKRDL
jgi:hypothetical protein